MTSELAHKAAFFFAALPATLAASARLSRHRKERLDELTRRMRRVKPFRLGFLRHPGYLLGTVDRVVRWLPPFGHGRCFKRSLLLLDLWSRCGLEPALHLGMKKDRRERDFHAWITTGPGGPRTSDAGHEELWSG